MNTPDNVWKKLAQAARQAPVNPNVEAPFGFAGQGQEELALFTAGLEHDPLPAVGPALRRAGGVDVGDVVRHRVHAQALGGEAGTTDLEIIEDPHGYFLPSEIHQL